MNFLKIAAVVVLLSLSVAPVYAVTVTGSPSSSVPSGNPGVDNPDIPNCFIGFSRKYPGVKCETLDMQAIYGNNGLWSGTATCVKVASATWECRNNYH